MGEELIQTHNGEKKTYEMTNVYVHVTPDGAYLTGNIFGDTDRNFPDGKFIRTSKLIDTVRVVDGTRYETMNSYYFVKDLISDDR